MLDRLSRSPSLSLIALAMLAACQNPVEPTAPPVPPSFPTPMPLFAVTQNVAVTDLGTLSAGGGGTHVAQDVNMLGTIVGTSTDDSGFRRSFYWTAAGGMVDLGTTGGDSAKAHGINDNDMVVGRSLDATGTTETFTWTSGGGLQALGTFGGQWSFGFGINNNDEISGTYMPSAGTATRAFTWSAGAGFTELPTLSANNAFANDINAAGEVVGIYATSPTDARMDSFIWDATNGIRALGTLGATFTEHVAFSINEFGTIAGAAFEDNTELFHPFFWHETNGYTDLKTQGFDAARSGLAFGVNNFGHMAVLILNSDGTRTPAVWMIGTGTVELPTLGGQDGEVWAINDLGMIVGWSQNAAGQMRPAMWELLFAPEERTQNAVDALTTIRDTTSSPGHVDKLNDVLIKANDAIANFQANPPNNESAVADLESAASELQGAIDVGAIDPDMGLSLLEVFTQAGRDVAVAAIDAAIARSGDPGKIADAQAELAEGDTFRGNGQHKDALAKYKSAIAIAESA